MGRTPESLRSTFPIPMRPPVILSLEEIPAAGAKALRQVKAIQAMLITVTANPPAVLLQAKGVDGLVRRSLQVRLPVAADDRGPAVTQLNVSPADASGPPTLIALASDFGRGDSTLARAEYFIDVVGEKGTGKPLTAIDGQYDSPTESIRAVVDAGDFAVLSNGVHTIYVRAKDTAGNWGVISSTAFQKMAPAAAQYYLSMPIAGTVQNSNGTSFTFAASDIVKLSVDSSGQYTYSMFLNGADVGLTLESENVNAISVRPDGSVLVSTTGAFSVASKYSAPAVGSGTAITAPARTCLGSCRAPPELDNRVVEPVFRWQRRWPCWDYRKRRCRGRIARRSSAVVHIWCVHRAWLQR